MTTSSIFWDVRPFRSVELTKFSGKSSISILCFPPTSCRLLAWLTHRHWRWKKYVPPNRRWTTWLHVVTYQEIRRFEVLTPLVKSTAFSDVKSCRLVDRYQQFGVTCCLHIYGISLFYREHGSSKFLRNFDNYLWIQCVLRNHINLDPLCDSVSKNGTVQ
jgi:hypothetical protein